MMRLLALVLVTAAATAGCRACSNCCDYSSPLVYSDGARYEPISPEAAVTADGAYSAEDLAADSSVFPAVDEYAEDEYATGSEPLQYWSAIGRSAHSGG